jgi:hypothetical protein
MVVERLGELLVWRGEMSMMGMLMVVSSVCFNSLLRFLIVA